MSAQSTNRLVCLANRSLTGQHPCLSVHKECQSCGQENGGLKISDKLAVRIPHQPSVTFDSRVHDFHILHHVFYFIFTRVFSLPISIQFSVAITEFVNLKCSGIWECILGCKTTTLCTWIRVVIGPVAPQSYKSRHDLYSGWMLYRAAKPGFSFVL